jgi:N-formylglutamate deformylase
VYLGDRVPDSAETDRRVEAYWRPYHLALRSELARLRDMHPNVLLWEAHSIASVLPRLFAGKLPDFNFGTSDGQSCHDTVIEGAIEAVRGTEWSWVVNGRFKGGFITRKYGDPAKGVHAIQLELCQSLYMEENEPFQWREDLAQRSGPFVLSAVERAVERVGRLDS